MREKLLLLMQNEKLSSSRLAELLEAQPSSISHLLSGRNKPSFDLIQKILRRFPRLNPDWLLLDSDQMYRADSLIGSVPIEQFRQEKSAPASGSIVTSGHPDALAEFAPEAVGQVPARQSQSTGIRQILVLYEDGTCENFRTRC